MRRRLAPRARARPARLRRFVAQICGRIVLIEEVDQRPRTPARQRHHPAPVLGRADRWQRRHPLGRVPAGLPVEAGGAVDPVHQVQFGVLRYRVVHGAVERLHPPVPLAVDQRRDDIHADLFARDVVRVPHLRRDRRRVVPAVRLGVVAAVHHRPAQREMGQIRAAITGPRPIVAERRHARPDDRVRQIVQRAARRRFQDHIGGRRQPRKVRPPPLRLQIQQHRPLAEPVMPPEQRTLGPGLILIERPIPPRRRPVRRLDDHDIRPHPRQ